MRAYTLVIAVHVGVLLASSPSSGGDAFSPQERKLRRQVELYYASIKTMGVEYDCYLQTGDKPALRPARICIGHLSLIRRRTK